MQKERWAILAAVLVLGWGSSVAQAAECTVNDDLTNPDASVTNATSCGPGVGNQTTAASLALAVPGDQTFTEVDKDEDANVLGDDDGGFQMTGTLLSGNWYIDTDGFAANSEFFLILKDGNIEGAEYDWYWFNVDEDNNAITCLPGYELCGTWEMYGTGGNQKELSHASLFVTTGDGPPPGETPEPGVLSLLALGLLALGFRRRRVR